MEALLSRSRTLSLSLLAGVLAAACNSSDGSGGGAQAGTPGAEVTKPGSTDTFFVDLNQSGKASRLFVEEMFWGRVVDIHDVDAFGVPSIAPVFRDFVINETTQTDAANYSLDTNPVTQKVRLVIRRTKGAPDTGTGTFDDLLADASSNLPAISPYGDQDFLIDDPQEDPDILARNSTLVVRFNDLLDDSINAENQLPATMKVLTGYPPETPFAPRMFFDLNHGGVVGGAFHSSRVLIDMTVSEEEAVTTGTTAPINNLGLPGSVEEDNGPNVSLRIPSRVDVGSGQFEILRNLSGAGLSTNSTNDPIDMTVPTNEIVRGMRSGRPQDENNGFLEDETSPRVLGSWPLVVTLADDDPSGVPGFDFVLAATFTTLCRARLEVGDVLTLGGRFLEAMEPSGDPDSNGQVANLRMRLLGVDPVTNPDELLGAGLFRSTYDPLVSVDEACWVSFTPVPQVLPATDVDPISTVSVRFTEPLDPDTLLPFDTMSVLRGNLSVVPSSSNTVVGQIIPSPEFNLFTFDPLLAFAHEQTGSQYNLRVGDVADLAGNPLANGLPPVLFNIDPNTPAEANGGVVLRFESTDEVPSLGANDLRGQFFYNFSEGVIGPRAVVFSSAAVDRNNPIPAAMNAILGGEATPLVPLGSKLHQVWRYADMGWLVEDGTRYDVDVVGLHWSPVGGQVLSDFYDQFEIRLAHSIRLPDEGLDENGAAPLLTNSGLVDPTGLFDNNILGGAGDQVVVHPRSLGYRVNPADLTQNAGGTFLMPYPLNVTAQDEDKVTYTWRDTANLGLGGANGMGVPLLIEEQLGIDAPPGRFFNQEDDGGVPTIGLPLLIEIRTFPSSGALGLNAMDISVPNCFAPFLALCTSIRPFHRNFSSGGFDAQGQPVSRNPDSEISPSGGFNPLSMPPGLSTMGSDAAVYMGELDYVTRISRAHTVWIDTNIGEPDFSDPILEIASRPDGTDILIDYRGAVTFAVEAGDEPFDASMLNPYGDPNAGVSTIDFITSENVWFSDIDDIDGARYLQMRITFVSNIATLLSPELSGIGIAFDDPD